MQPNHTTEQYIAAMTDPLLKLIEVETVTLGDQGRRGTATAVAKQVLEVILSEMLKRE